MEDSRFLELVREAIETLPEDFKQVLDNIEMGVEDWPDPELLEQLGYGRKGLLLGLYQGVPLTRRRAWSIPGMPDRIVIYKKAIEAISHNDEEVRDRVRTTVLHEVGHFFGLDDRKLKEDGYG